MNARVLTFRSPLRLVPGVLAIRDSRPTSRGGGAMVRERISTLKLRPDAPFPSEIKAGRERVQRSMNDPAYMPEPA